jgi:hypothetical protein
MIITAMKLALEALKAARRGHCDHAWADEAITALRTAIEAAEKQEPVAWRYTNVAGVSVMHWHKSAKLDADIQAAKEDPLAHKVTPLYTTPPAQPAQRQPLTDEQIMQTWEGIIKYAPGEVRLRDFARAIEAAHGIKEKNSAV